MKIKLTLLSFGIAATLLSCNGTGSESEKTDEFQVSEGSGSSTETQSVASPLEGTWRADEASMVWINKYGLYLGKSDVLFTINDDLSFEAQNLPNVLKNYNSTSPVQVPLHNMKGTMEYNVSINELTVNFEPGGPYPGGLKTTYFLTRNGDGVSSFGFYLGDPDAQQKIEFRKI